MKLTRTHSADEPGHEGFLWKIKREIEQHLIQIELSQRGLFRAVSTTGMHLDRKMLASNTSWPQERQALVLALHPRSVGNWKCVQQCLCSESEGAVAKEPSQHSKALQVGFRLIPLTVQMSHKLWRDSRNFSSERKSPGGLKPVCPTLPNFLVPVLQDEAEGLWGHQCCHCLVACGCWQLLGTARAWKGHCLFTNVPERSRVYYRSMEGITSSLGSLHSARFVIHVKLVRIILIISEKLWYWFTKAE